MPPCPHALIPSCQVRRNAEDAAAEAIEPKAKAKAKSDVGGPFTAPKTAPVDPVMEDTPLLSLYSSMNMRTALNAPMKKVLWLGSDT